MSATNGHKPIIKVKNVVSQGKTMIMVTHSKELARQVPRVIEITDGKITRDERS